MKKETYESIFRKVQTVPKGVWLIQALGKGLTYVAAAVYFMTIALQLHSRKIKTAVILVAVPAVSFLLVSVFRKCYNAKRPYEIYGFQPLLPKETKGKSFPSRHVFSIFVIGSTIIWFYPATGAFLCLAGCILAVIRVVTGVHFPKDVAVGALTGILCGCVAELLKVLG
ncbi:MAG TPA: phosphatase PAP2 family protein [Lachnospiraceae bacterium]|nr:phosphatase PAP2 family protein [Lachnospiraceae bacterium]